MGSAEDQTASSGSLSSWTTGTASIITGLNLPPKTATKLGISRKGPDVGHCPRRHGMVVAGQQFQGTAAQHTPCSVDLGDGDAQPQFNRLRRSAVDEAELCVQAHVHGEHPCSGTTDRPRQRGNLQERPARHARRTDRQGRPTLHAMLNQ